MNNLLKQILEIQSYSKKTENMRQFILSKYGKYAKIDKKGNIYLTKGDTEFYPCLVAHIDTVHELIPQEYYKVIETGDFAFAVNVGGKSPKPTGIGGDDKVGIYIALSLFEEFENIKVALFVDEEIGCVGSFNANLDFFKDVAYIIESDRKGYKDVISDINGLGLCSTEFVAKIESVVEQYDKEFNQGMMTDVLVLKEQLPDINMLNLSCGYYKPHTVNEYLVLSEVEKTKEFVKELIFLLGEEKMIDTENKTYKKPYKFKWSNPFKWSASDDITDIEFDDDNKDKHLNNEVCPYCSTHTIYMSKQYNDLYCMNCGSIFSSKEELKEEQKQYFEFLNTK